MFEWSTVGNAGNLANIDGHGAVGYDYRISKHEVTNAQYVEFLNAVDPAGANALNTYVAGMASGLGGITFDANASEAMKYAVRDGRGNQPVSFVSWNSAARFVNWLHNGQGNGSTEVGAYTLADGDAMTRSVNASFFIPSEDEWYKATYHDATAGLAGTYFTQGTSTNELPHSDHPDDDPTGANYFYNDRLNNGYNEGYAVSRSTTRPENPLTDVGAYTQALSPYGLFDVNGNVFEWTEGSNTSDTRVLRGGSFQASRGFLWPEFFLDQELGVEDEAYGFRVAATVVPEPSTGVLFMLAGGVLFRRRR